MLEVGVVDVESLLPLVVDIYIGPGLAIVGAVGLALATMADYLEVIAV